METITQRQLRNDNASIVRGVESGESYTVTRRGVPVAHLIPVVSASEIAPSRPARSRAHFSSWARVRSSVRTAEVLDDLRGDR